MPQDERAWPEIQVHETARGRLPRGLKARSEFEHGLQVTPAGLCGGPEQVVWQQEFGRGHVAEELLLPAHVELPRDDILDEVRAALVAWEKCMANLMARGEPSFSTGVTGIQLDAVASLFRDETTRLSHLHDLDGSHALERGNERQIHRLSHHLDLSERVAGELPHRHLRVGQAGRHREVPCHRALPCSSRHSPSLLPVQLVGMLWVLILVLTLVLVALIELDGPPDRLIDEAVVVGELGAGSLVLD